MATLKIEERIVINAPVERVWKFLLDPERVVQCLPGAAYDGAESEHVFLGHIKVKVGPVSTMFAGKATMSEIDEAAHTLRISGAGKDKNGAGTAKMEMIGKVTAVDGGAELAVDADVDVAGKLVTFGRGLIKSVSAELFKQFSARAQALLTEEEEAAGGAEAEAGDGGGEGEKAAGDGGGEGEGEGEGEKAAGDGGDGGKAAGDAEKAGGDAEKASGEKLARPKAAASGLAKRPAQQEESLNALSLLFRALASSLAGFFRRLFGRKGS
ncbi:MAG: SRPBCC family protein [Kofleriaceae bacterium]